MMDWTDRHCRYFFRLITPRARLVHRNGDDRRDDVRQRAAASRLRSGRASDCVAARRQRPVRARALRAAGRSLGLRRDQPERRLSQRARADRQLRRLPDGRARAGRRLRRGDARRRCAPGDGQAPHRHRCGRRIRIHARLRRHRRRGRRQRVHRPRQERDPERPVAEGESRDPAAEVRIRAPAEARLSRACDRHQRRDCDAWRYRTRALRRSTA